MEILIFDAKWIETAKAFEIRTGLEICKGEWKPEQGKQYIIYGAEKQPEALLAVQESLGCKYVIMNSLRYQEIHGTKYEELVKNSGCIMFESDMEAVRDFTDKGIVCQFIVHESFHNKNEDRRPIGFLYNETDCLNDLLLDPSVTDMVIRDNIDYSINQLTEYFCNSKCYISHKKNDWVNINKAIACGCSVISLYESKEMMQMYEPHVRFHKYQSIKSL